MQVWDGKNKKILDQKNVVYTFTTVAQGYFLQDCTGDITIIFTIKSWKVIKK